MASTQKVGTRVWHLCGPSTRTSCQLADIPRTVNCSLITKENFRDREYSWSFLAERSIPCLSLTKSLAATAGIQSLTRQSGSTLGLYNIVQTQSLRNNSLSRAFWKNQTRHGTTAHCEIDQGGYKEHLT